MITTPECCFPPEDCKADPAQFRADVLRGLRAPAKELPCKYFYDEAGSDLFERITELEEYYPSRTERAILQQMASELAGLLGRRCLMIEYGSGSSAKTRLLLDHLLAPAGYVPIDVSAKSLHRSARALAADIPGAGGASSCADFTRLPRLPTPARRPERRVVYFPGSTIGNFTPPEAIALLKQTADLCSQGEAEEGFVSAAPGGLVLGADLRKDPRVIEAAYNDSAGVTAAFNRNLLVRINRELAADFVVEQFAHHAFYNRAEGRIEMHLVSRCDQRVRVGDAEFFFAVGESVRTEYSYKYRLRDLRDLAGAAGFATERVWTDERGYFSVSYFTVQRDAPNQKKASSAEFVGEI